MTYLEALYGSQYEEVRRSGKDGNKGRFNGNLFLSVFLILFIVSTVLLLALIYKVITRDMGILVKIGFVGSNGRLIGKLLGLLFLGLFYFILTKTVGSQKNFNKLVDKYKTYPEETKKRATNKLLIPFFILLISTFVLAFLN